MQTLNAPAQAGAALYGVLLVGERVAVASPQTLGVNPENAPAQAGAALYGVLLAGERVVALAQPRAQPLAPADLLLLGSFLTGVDSFRAAPESFSPICLPAHNPSAFLHAYVAYLDQVSPRRSLTLTLCMMTCSVWCPWSHSCGRQQLVIAIIDRVCLLTMNGNKGCMMRSRSCCLTRALAGERPLPGDAGAEAGRLLRLVRGSGRAAARAAGYRHHSGACHIWSCAKFLSLTS